MNELGYIVSEISFPSAINRIVLFLSSNTDYFRLWQGLILLLCAAAFYMSCKHKKSNCIPKVYGHFFVFQSISLFFQVTGHNYQYSQILFFISEGLQSLSYLMLLITSLKIIKPQSTKHLLIFTGIAILTALISVVTFHKFNLVFFSISLGFIINLIFIFTSMFKPGIGNISRNKNFKVFSVFVFLFLFIQIADKFITIHSQIDIIKKADIIIINGFLSVISLMILFFVAYYSIMYFKISRIEKTRLDFFGKKQAVFLIGSLFISGLILINILVGQEKIKFDKRLIQKARFFAQNFNQSHTQALDYTISDRAKSGYIKLRSQFNAYAKYEGLSSIYSLKLKNDSLFFGPENTDYETNHDTINTQHYQNPPVAFKEALLKGECGVTGRFKDEYGSFYSAYAPVYDKAGKTNLLIVIDIPENQRKAQLASFRLNIIIGFLVLILAAFLIRFIYSLRETYHFFSVKNISLITGFALMFGFLIAFLSHRNNEKNAKAEWHKKLHYEISEHIEMTVKRVTEMTRMQAEIIKTSTGEYIRDNEPALSVLKTIQHLLEASIVFVLDSTGTTVACTPYDDNQTLTGNNYAFRPYFKESFSKGKSQFYPAIGVTTGEIGFYFSQPILNHDKISGVLVIKSNLDAIQEKLNVFPYPAALVSEKGIIIASNQPDWILKTAYPLSDEDRKSLKESRQFSDEPLPDLGLDILKPVSINNVKHDVIKGQTFFGQLQLISLQPQSSPVLLSVITIVLGTSISILLVFALIAFGLGYTSSQKALANSEEKFRKLFEDSYDASLIMENGIFVNCNQAAVQLLNYESKADIINKSPNDLSPKYQDDGILSKQKASFIIDFILKNTTSYRFEWLLLKNDRTVVPVEVHVNKISIGSNPVYYTIWKDISDRIKAERELERYREHLEELVEERTQKLEKEMAERVKAENLIQQQLNKLEAQNAELERFTYTVSHDLKSPLITINGFLEQIIEDAKNGSIDELDSDAQRIRNAVNKMSKLLTDLLDLSRIGRVINANNTFHFGDLIKETIESLRGIIDQSGLRIEFETDFPIVKGDRERINEVIQNLIENAVKYKCQEGVPHLSIGYKAQDNELLFWFADNGIGIEPRYLDKIFGLFEKLDASTQGNGIGLALTKRIIEFHGGNIWAESEGSGKGTTFCFTLPNII